MLCCLLIDGLCPTTPRRRKRFTVSSGKGEAPSASINCDRGAAPDGLLPVTIGGPVVLLACGGVSVQLILDSEEQSGDQLRCEGLTARQIRLGWERSVWVR